MHGEEKWVIVQCKKCGRRKHARVFVSLLGMFTDACNGYEWCCDDVMRPIRQHTYKPKRC